MVPTLRGLEGANVVDAKGAALGRITHVLCDPENAVVVGFEVQPPNVAYVVSRTPRYFALAGANVSTEVVAIEEPKTWSGERAEKVLGFEWARTVIWVGMPVGPPDGEAFGYVRDASFDAASGAIARILVSDGLTSDLAVGTREFDGAQVERFDGAVIRVSETAADAAFSGGAARAAGTGAAVAKVVVSDAARRAAGLGGSAVKAAAKSKPARTAWTMLRETGKAFRDGFEEGKE
jgi:uncharacterized protein YrrD